MSSELLDQVWETDRQIQRYFAAQAVLNSQQSSYLSLSRLQACATMPAVVLYCLVQMQSVSSLVTSLLLSFRSGCIRVRWTVALIVTVVSWSHLITNKRYCQPPSPGLPVETQQQRKRGSKGNQCFPAP